MTSGHSIMNHGVGLMIIVLGQEERYCLIDFGISKFLHNMLGVSMQAEKVVELHVGPYPGFPHLDGRIIEFSCECCQVLIFDILYGLKLTGVGKGPELAQAYPKGREERLEKSAKVLYSRNFLQ
jgi:hypothetical protein